MSPRVLWTLVAIVLIVVVGMVLTIKKAVKPRDVDAPVKTVPAKK